MPDRIFFFFGKFAIKLFRISVANADIESLKYLRTFFPNSVFYMLYRIVKFEQNHMVTTTRRNFDVFEQKNDFRQNGCACRQNGNATVEDVSIAKTIYHSLKDITNTISSVQKRTIVRHV